MTTVFYAASAVAIVAGALAVTRANALHALLYLVLALFALSLMFLTLGAPFIAALEIIVYAGAIMVLILFVIMMLNLGAATRQRERKWLSPRAWIMPSLLATALTVALLAAVAGGAPARGGAAAEATRVIGPGAVGASLFSTYIIGVELAAVLLLVGLVGAHYLGVRE